MNESMSNPLMEHQKRFIERWLSTSPSKAAMVWPAGAGAIGTLCAMVERLDKNWRTLVIADRQDIVQQFAHRQGTAGVQTCVIDRYTYRALESETGGASTSWNTSRVYALTSAMASQTDIASSLQRQAWDFLILIDTTNSTSKKILEGLSVNAKRVLWKLRPGTAPSTLDASIWDIDYLSVRDLMREQGVPEGEGPSVEIRIHESEYSEREYEISSFIEQLVTTTKGTSVERLAASMHTRWLSSPAALENGLRKLESDLRTEWPIWEASVEDVDGVDLPLEKDLTTRGDPALPLQIISNCLNQLDELQFDPKLNNLLEHLRKRDPEQSIAVFVRYRDTGVYLHAALEDEGIPSLLVHGAMPPQEIYSRMDRVLQEQGQVLVMTTAMLVGMDLRRVGEFVLYDAPASKAVMSQLLAKFHMFGRPQLRVTAIADRHTAAKTMELIEDAVQFAA